MSRYTLLVLLNAPLIAAAIVSAIVNYKLKKIQKRRLIFRLSLWTLVFAGLVLAEPIYTYLYKNELTQTEPLSLFDTLQITVIIVLLFSVSRIKSKHDHLERRVRDLHQELSIQLSTVNRQDQ